jgi:hypothetical protein
LEDFVDPEDLLNQPSTDCIAERKLWCAVLEQAVADCRGLPTADTSARGYERDGNRRVRIMSAKAWMTYDGDEPGSFRWVIRTLGLRKGVSEIRRACGVID